MSHEATLHGHDDHGHHEHHDTFLTKYVFSQDHKMIAKQFLITGVVWAVLGGLMSVLFRLQLGYPDASFPVTISRVNGQKVVKLHQKHIML